jgi:N-acetyl-anhydromuramyl-L-alanine amidase AmpD
MLKSSFVVLSSLVFLVLAVSCKSSPSSQSAVSPAQVNTSEGYGEGFVLSQSDLTPFPSEAIEKCALAIQAPTEKKAFADPTNYGLRDSADYMGRKLLAKPKIIVIHETVMGEKDTIALFQTNHPRDEDQVSYHMLIGRDGKLVRIVPDDKRAYGAGMSQFMGSTLRTKKGSVGSINNIALHISLVSPAGYNNSDSHSGYTREQYSTLAAQILNWQIRYGIPMSRVSTHYAVDRSHSRYDPRSFHWDKFDTVHQKYAALCGAEAFEQPA